MSGIKPGDEYFHGDYPRNITDIWKENWYFNFIDLNNKAWGYNHFSLRRDNQHKWLKWLWGQVLPCNITYIASRVIGDPTECYFFLID